MTKLPRRGFRKKIKIRDGIKKIISQKTLNLSQLEALNSPFMADEIFAGINTFVGKMMKVVLKLLRKNQMNNQTLQTCLI